MTPVSRPAQDAAAEYNPGREGWARRGESSLNAATEHFTLAIEKRPDYGLAYSGLADAYLLLPFCPRIMPLEAMVHPYIRKGMYDKAFELQMRYPQEMGDTTRSAIVNKLADSHRSNGCRRLSPRADSYRSHFPDLLEMNEDPELDSLRSDPRFHALRRQVGLPAQGARVFLTYKPR